MLGTGAMIASRIGAELKSELVVAIERERHSQFWYGVNASGQLLAVIVRPTTSELIGAIKHDASESELKQILDLVETTRVEDAPKSISGPRELQMRPPGLALTRITVWRDGSKHETSVSGLEHAPDAIQMFAEKLDALCQKGEKVTPVATVLSINLSRTFGPDAIPYADLYRRQGKIFREMEEEDLSRSIRAVCQYPGTMETVDRDELKTSVSPMFSGQSEAFVSISGRPLMLKLFTAQASQDTDN